jgi:hypothetical protein
MGFAGFMGKVSAAHRVVVRVKRVIVVLKRLCFRMKFKMENTVEDGAEAKKGLPEFGCDHPAGGQAVHEVRFADGNESLSD